MTAFETTVEDRCEQLHRFPKDFASHDQAGEEVYLLFVALADPPQTFLAVFHNLDTGSSFWAMRVPNQVQSWLLFQVCIRAGSILGVEIGLRAVSAMAILCVAIVYSLMPIWVEKCKRSLGMMNQPQLSGLFSKS